MASRYEKKVTDEYPFIHPKKIYLSDYKTTIDFSDEEFLNIDTPSGNIKITKDGSTKISGYSINVISNGNILIKAGLTSDIKLQGAKISPSGNFVIPDKHGIYINNDGLSSSGSAICSLDYFFKSGLRYANGWIYVQGDDYEGYIPLLPDCAIVSGKTRGGG